MKIAIAADAWAPQINGVVITLSMGRDGVESFFDYHRAASPEAA